MKILNANNLPEALVNAVTPKAPHNKEGCVSATTLIRGAKETILINRHFDEMEDDASNRVYAILGTAVHSIFERAKDKPGVIREQEFSKKVGNYTVTGRLDRFDPETKTLFDYKMTSVYKVKAASYEEWYTQLMIYAWLLRDAGYEVNKLCINAILRDWSRSEAKRDKSYPQTQVVLIPFDINDNDYAFIEDFITNKVAELEAADKLEDNAIPACSEKERWEKPPKFAVMKKGAARSIKNFDEERDAVQYLAKIKNDPKYKKDKDNLIIEHRLGTSVKCADYCSCCKFCNFYKEHVDTDAE